MHASSAVDDLRSSDAGVAGDRPLDDDHDHDGQARRDDGPSLRGLLTGGAVAAVGCAAIALTNPTDSGTPICVSQIAFGVDCPLCGGLRCVNSLLRGDIAAAADHNVFATIALPVIALWWIVAVVTRLQKRPLRRVDAPSWALVSLGVVLLAFTVVRNAATSGWLEWLASTAY